MPTSGPCLQASGGVEATSELLDVAGLAQGDALSEPRRTDSRERNQRIVEATSRREAGLEAEARVVAGRAVPAGPVMVRRPVASGPAAAPVPEPDRVLAVQAQARECLVRDSSCWGHAYASSIPSRSSSGAVSCSTMVPASTSNLPEQATQTPDVPEPCASSVPSRGGLPEPRHRPT